MCVFPSPGLLKTIHMKLSLNNQSIKPYCFLVSLYGTCFRYYDGQGLSMEAHRELLQKEQGNAVFAVHYMVKTV